MCDKNWKKVKKFDKMSSFAPQKSFEKSLRSSSVPFVVSTIAPLKTEIHKGCTGKAHACGSVKIPTTQLKPPTTPKPKVKSDGKSLRKNSLSSETVSDSGSEISSWNSNKESSTSSTTSFPNPLKRTKSVNYGSAKSSPIVRRRISDSVVVPDSGNNFRRGRLLSDEVEDKKKVNGSDEPSRLRRSSSFRSKNIPPMIPPKPKMTQPTPSSPIKRNGSFNSRLRNSFRNKSQVTSWSALWESSQTSKMGGGSLKVLDKKILESFDKVKYVFERIWLMIWCGWCKCDGFGSVTDVDRWHRKLFKVFATNLFVCQSCSIIDTESFRFIFNSQHVNRRN